MPANKTATAVNKSTATCLPFADSHTLLTPAFTEIGVGFFFFPSFSSFAGARGTHFRHTKLNYILRPSYGTACEDWGRGVDELPGSVDTQ